MFSSESVVMYFPFSLATEERRLEFMSNSNIQRTYYVSAAFKVFFAKDKSQETLKNSICCTCGKVIHRQSFTSTHWNKIRLLFWVEGQKAQF